MKKISLKMLSVIVCITIILTTLGTVYALGGKKEEKAQNDNKETLTASKENVEQKETVKDETVYVIAGSDGSVKKIIVSDWIKNTLCDDEIYDVTSLDNIENVKGEEKYTLNSDNMTVWDAEGNDIYYKGNIEKELPVGLCVSYKLDGKTVKAEDLAGKSGKVTIRFDYENKQYQTVNIDGVDEKIYVPFVLLTGMVIDSDTFRNVEISNGKLINDGNRTFVIGIALPGLQENLGISKDKIEIPDYVEITADVTDFKMGMTVTLATNELFSKIDTSKLNSIDDITASVGELTSGVSQLVDGSSALYSGLTTLLGNTSTLISGINTACDGAKTLSDAGVTLDEGVGTLKGGVDSLSSGLGELSSNSASLSGGAKQIFETLLNTAYTQLTAQGITLPKLTIENFDEVLGGVIASLDSNAVYSKALSEVTSAVEANRAEIALQVTSAVRGQVAEKLIPIATEGQMTKSSYDEAKEAGMLDETVVASIEGAIDAEMQKSEIQNRIVQSTNEQIAKLISENMESDTVKEKLSKASEGAKSVAALKKSLDDYNTFYLGLNTYASGVNSAALGAAELSGGAAELKKGTEQIKDGLASLYGGILQIKNGMPALKSGISQLHSGAMQLSAGLKKLNDDGIAKIDELVNGDIKGLVTRIKASADVSAAYRNFAGIADGTDGHVKFIYRTDEIK